MKNKVNLTWIGWKAFLVTYTIVMIFIITICVMETQERVPATLMIIYPLIGIVIIIGMTFLGVKIEHFLDKHEKKLLFAFFVLYTIATVRFTLHSRGIPTNDSESLVSGAYYMAGLSDESNWHYFARCSNNTMPMVFLSVLFRIAAWLNFTDVYYLPWALKSVQVLCTLYCVYKLGKRVSRHGSVSGWLVMGMMAIYVPIWAHTQSLYTDAFSFGFGIIAFYIWLQNYEKRKSGWKYWLINIAVGVIWGIGFQIKATSVISLVAVVIYVILFEHWKLILKNVVTIICPVLVIGSICSNYMKTLPLMEHQDTWAFPVVEYFIGLGLEADGSFRLDSEFFNTLCSIWGMEEKKAYAREFIMENVNQFWNSEHMIAKARVNFASGKMKADDFMQIVEHEGFVYNCVSYTGAYRRTYRTYVAAYWYMLLEFIVIACVLRTFVKNNSKKESPVVFVPIMSVCGIMMYVMIFEANNRQLYNHIPMIFSAANIGIWELQSRVEMLALKCKNKVGGRYE